MLRLHPFLVTDRYLIRDGPDDYAKRMIPSNAVHKGIIFANCDTYEAMKKGVYEKLSALGTHFGARERYDLDGKYPVEEIGMRTENIFKNLELVEQSMEGIIRRTGERAFAHEIRCLLRGIDFIWENLRAYNGSKQVIPFTPASAELFLMQLIDHDLTEPDSVRPDGTYEGVRGKVWTRFETGSPQDSGIFIKGHRKLGGLGATAEELLIHLTGISPLHAVYFRQGLEALNNYGKTPAEQFRQLDALLEQFEGDLPLTERARIFAIIPRIAKNIDRLDNLYTYPFRLAEEDYQQLKVHPEEAIMSADDSRYSFVATDPRLIQEKALETIQYFFSSEDHLLWMMSNLDPKLSLDAGSWVRTFTKPSLEAIFRPEIAKMRPTRIALLMLLGCGPDQLFGNLTKEEVLSIWREDKKRILSKPQAHMQNPWHIPGPWIPQPI